MNGVSKLKKIKMITAWQYCSKYIRARDKVCVICGSTETLQAGHVVPVGNSGLRIKFFEPDIFGQCSKCNMAHSYDNTVYFDWYDSKFAREKRDRINAIKRNSSGLNVSWVTAFQPGDYVSVRHYYIDRLDKLIELRKVHGADYGRYGIGFPDSNV